MEIADENLPPCPSPVKLHVQVSSPRSSSCSRQVLMDIKEDSLNTIDSLGPTQSPESEVGKCGDCQPDPEAEAWSERTAVITKYDHEIHCQLARNFVNDIADKVVTDSEHLKSGSLPDLVPSPSEKSRPDELQTDDSEYESADELPLQDTIYLDSTISGITPSRSAVEESTLRLDATVVLDSSREQSQATAAVEDQLFLCEEVNEAIPQADQHRSPVHDKTLSDAVESAAGDSASDALSPDTVPGDLDVDFILQFEKLALNNQKSAGNNHNQDCLSDNYLVADSQTKEDHPVQDLLSEEVEFNPDSISVVDEIVQEPSKVLHEITENTSDSISEVIGTEPVNETVQGLVQETDTDNAPNVFPADSAVINDTVCNSDSKSVPVDAVPASETPETIHIHSEEASLVEKLLSDLNSSQVAETTSKEEELIVSTEDHNQIVINEIASEEQEIPIVPKRGYDLSFLDKFEDLENASPSIVSGKSSQSKEQTIIDENFICEDRLENPVSLEIQESEKEQDPNAPEREDCVENASSNPCIQLPVPEEITLPTEEHTDSSNNTSDSAAAGEEAIIVPKKGYDLSFLDKLDDIENASPSAISNPSKLKGASSKTEMKETVVSDTTSDTVRPPKNSDSQESVQENQEASKKQTKRIPIRPRVAKNTSTTKRDPFEVEFTFDPSEDPFKPKAKLASSPPKDQFTPATELDSEQTKTMENDSSDNTLTINGNGTDTSLSNSTHEPALDNRLSFGTQVTRKNDIGEEEFRPATEVFQDPSELDFLLQHGGNSKEIALARQSLYVKFDPLVGGRPSLFPNKSENTVNEETIIVHEEEEENGTKGESLFFFSPPHPSSNNGRLEGCETKNQPVQALFVAGDVIGLNEHKEALKVQELLFQDRLLQKEREIQVKETDCQELKGKLESTLEAQAQMRQIVGEYEKTISQLIAEKEREKANMEATLQTTMKEKEQAIEDLKEVERAFSEFHKMYERNRAAAEGLHKNEEALKKALAAYQERLQQEQHKYETLKLHAAQKLEGAQQEMENMKRTLEAENARIKAVLKKTEMRLASVETSLEQKSKENEELTKLCDELINKLGSSGSQ